MYALRTWSWGLIAMLCACSGDRQADPRTVFRYNQAEGITSLDPAFARNLENMWACDQIFDGLVEMGPDLRVRPGIADHWDITDSGRTYTFHLRSDVHFHPSEAFPDGLGRRVVAEDFRYSFERIRDPRTASPGRWVFEHVLPGEEGFQAVNDSTFVIRLQRPFPPFTGILSMIYASVVPREAVALLGSEWRRRPVGAGPFRFFHWEEGVKLALQRNERYHQQDEDGTQLPYLDAVTVGFVKDRNAEFLALVKGELDMMSGTEGSAVNELLDPLGRIRPRHAEHIHLERAPALATDYLGFLLDSSSALVHGSPWRDARLRRALGLAIDRQRLVTHLQHGIGMPAGSILPPGMPGASGVGRGHDPGLARRLMAEAGHPEGRGLPPLTLTATASYLELCEFIQHELAAFGVRIIVDAVPLSTHKEGTANGDFAFFRKNWIADYPDAENFLMLFTSANSAPAGPNYTRFSMPEMDALYQQALHAVDDSARMVLYQRMDSLVITEAPAVFLTHPEVVRFVRNEVSGLVADPMNQLDLRRVRKAVPAAGK
jgi:oligopeptide transport system substrate-binding protein